KPHRIPRLRAGGDSSKLTVANCGEPDLSNRAALAFGANGSERRDPGFSFAQVSRGLLLRSKEAARVASGSVPCERLVGVLYELGAAGDAWRLPAYPRVVYRSKSSAGPPLWDPTPPRGSKATVRAAIFPASLPETLRLLFCYPFCYRTP